jgi:hypothetical protein
MDYTDTKVSVSPFSDSYEAIKDVPIATVSTAWDDPATGEVIVLYINEALYFGDKMSPHTLLCPNQLHASRWKVQDVPKQFDAESAHAIIDPTGTLRMPLEMSGVISFLPTWRPTDEELETCASYVLSRTGAADGCSGGFSGGAGGLYQSSKHGGGAVIVRGIQPHRCGSVRRRLLAGMVD